MNKRLCFLLFCFMVLSLVFQSFAQVQVGSGSYATSGSFSVPSSSPYITEDCPKKVISNKWWVTLITEGLSQNMYAHPLSLKAVSSGLEIGYPGGFNSKHSNSLRVGVDGLNSTTARVCNIGHWSVTARWEGGGRLMEATMGNGMPFVFFKIQGGNAAISTSGNVWYNEGGVLGITADGKHFGIFAPTGSSWSTGGTLISSLNGKDYLSVALLPDNTQATLEFFKQHAYAFVTDTYVMWDYSEIDAQLISHWMFITEPKEGTEDATIFAIMRHQWAYGECSWNTDYTYISPRGEMKVSSGTELLTSMTFNGILMGMPDAGYDEGTLGGYINSASPPTIRGSTYNKDFGKWAVQVHIADKVGNTSKRDQILDKLKDGLQTWFTAGSSPQFYYHDEWDRLIGYPAAYYSDTRLTDHHFHYGYYVRAAATVARWDDAWADNWGGMVEMLIRDVNSWDDDDPLFNRFGYFEPYEGHGWADGMGFGDGNNQESSSESMSFNAGTILYGMNTGNDVIRDLGIFMYTNETRAIEQYWWDVDEEVFSSSFNHTCVGMVWSNGGAYSTWFSGNTGAIHGINFLPITAGHLYIGRRPDYIPKNYEEGFSGQWTDLFYEFLAFADGETAWSRYAGGTGIEGGNSPAYCYHHMASVRAAGQLKTNIVCDVPGYAVFDKGNTRTYTAYNPNKSSAITVTFSDGFNMQVPANEQVTMTGDAVPVKGNSIPKLQKPAVMTKLINFIDSFQIPALDKDIRKVEVYNLLGKKVWESRINVGETLKEYSVPKPVVKGMYIFKAYQ